MGGGVLRYCMINAYCDGGVSMKAGIGGWAVVFVEEGGGVSYINGYDRRQGVTNNKMEMMGVIMAMKYCAEHYPGQPVTITSDSEYIVKGCNEWLDKWVLKQWKTTTGPVKNQNYWQEIKALRDVVKPTIQWCRGHDGNEYNEMADKLCVGAYQQALTDNKTGVSYQHDNQ